MPFEVKLSQFASKAVFENTVTIHAARMNAFGAEVGKPRPVAHPLVEASLRRIVTPGKPDEYVPDYIISEDRSPEAQPTMTLEEKKQALVDKLADVENAARNKIIPRRKLRLKSGKYNLAMRVKEEDRTPEQIKDIGIIMDARDAWDKISMAGAEIEAEIDDLTEDTIGNWVMPSLE